MLREVTDVEISRLHMKNDCATFIEQRTTVRHPTVWHRTLVKLAVIESVIETWPIFLEVPRRPKQNSLVLRCKFFISVFPFVVCWAVSQLQGLANLNVILKNYIEHER